MGQYKGQRIFYAGGRTMAELVEDGTVIAIPDATVGIIYKRAEDCTPLEIAAKLSVAEARRITDEWNAALDK
jgi:hypothetical protein